MILPCSEFTDESLVSDEEWTKVCSSSIKESWHHCTRTSLYVLRERRINRLQAKEQCDTLQLTKWPSQTSCGQPFPNVPASLVSIQTCQELHSVLRLAAHFMQHGQSSSNVPIWTDDLRTLRKQESQFTDHHNSVVVTVVKNVNNTHPHSSTISAAIPSDHPVPVKLQVGHQEESHSLLDNHVEVVDQGHNPIRPQTQVNRHPHSDLEPSSERQNINSFLSHGARWQQSKLESRPSRSIGFGMKWFKMFTKSFDHPKPAFGSLIISKLASPLTGQPVLHYRSSLSLETHHYSDHHQTEVSKTEAQNLNHFLKEQSRSSGTHSQSLRGVSGHKRLGWETKNARIALVQVNLHADQPDALHENKGQLADQPVKRWTDNRLCPDEVPNSMQTRKVKDAEFAK